jgi:hypothetical protein
MIRFVSIALALLVLGTTNVGLAEDDSERAEQAFKEGNRAFAAGDFHRAFDAYRLAWSLKQTFDIACNLGRTEVELSLARDAAEHLDFCLRTFSVSSRGEVRDANKRFRELFQRVRREVTALSLEVRPSGAEVTVDGASYGPAPLGRELFLAPGSHLLRARLAGYQDEERAVTAEAGGTLSVTITLSAASPSPAPVAVPAARAAETAPAAPAPGRARRAAPPARGIEPRTIVLISGAAVSLVALGVGAYFSLDADAARDDASKLGSTLHQSAVPGCGAGASSPDCSALRAAVEREERSRDRADAALVTGALLGAASLGAWLLIPDIARAGRARIKAAPWVAGHASGVAVLGAY